MQFVLKIELGNDAMRTPAHVRCALKTVAEKLRQAGGYERWPIEGAAGVVRDENGNRVGSWEVNREDEGK